MPRDIFYPFVRFYIIFITSSLLVGLLSEAGAEKILAFSIGFEDTPEESGSEFEYSDKVVERFNTEHRKIHIPNNEVLARLPNAIDNMSEPMFAQDAVAFICWRNRSQKKLKSFKVVKVWMKYLVGIFGIRSCSSKVDQTCIDLVHIILIVSMMSFCKWCLKNIEGKTILLR